jgi:hypothetical protein
MAITLQITFTEEEAGMLWYQAHKGFFTDQQDRFEFIIRSTEEADAAFILENEALGRGIMKWCESKLHAKFLQSYLSQADGVKSILLNDLAADHDRYDSGWIVWTNADWADIWGPLNEERGEKE